MLLSEQCYCPRMTLKIDQKIFHVRYEVRDKRIFKRKSKQFGEEGEIVLKHLEKKLILNKIWMKWKHLDLQNNINSSEREEKLKLCSDLIRIRLGNSPWMLLLMVESHDSFVLFHQNTLGRVNTLEAAISNLCLYSE